MHTPEERLIGIMRDAGVDFLTTLPCDRVKNLIALADKGFFRLPLTREEEGVGICAGAALGGKRPAMILQSSGVGNLLNALLSLTQYYSLPLPLFVSQRGIYKEGIAAQGPMGRCLPDLFRAVGVGYSEIRSPDDFDAVERGLGSLYEEGRIHAFLLSPEAWEGSTASMLAGDKPCICEPVNVGGLRNCPLPELTRYGIIEALAPVLEGKAVVCNLGIPAKELHAVLPQSSNFYMMGSMGMVTPIGLGLALATDEQVFVIDGDGSLLMNPGTLATVALGRPKNLTIIAIDNASYGSTGNQPTLTGTCVDLELLARSMGITDTVKTGSADEIVRAAQSPQEGPRFIHAVAQSGNAKVDNIPLDADGIRDRFTGWLREQKGP